MVDESCIFCKLANGEIPTKSIYEDERFRVILDMSPATKGHALILPKDHYENLYELPDDLAGNAMILAKKVAVRMKEVLGCQGLNIVQNNGTLAGQTVFHFHVHVIPQYLEDNQKISWIPGEATTEELDKMREKISF